MHDWFRAHGAIDELLLTVEPCRFGAGLPVFSDQPEGRIEAALAQMGFDPVAETRLNAAGTRLIRFHPKG